MNRAQYWILNSVSLLVAALIGFEIDSVHQLDDVGARLQRAQAPLLAAQQSAPEMQHLLQRTAVGALRDPELKAVLAKYGISVTARSGDAPGTSTKGRDTAVMPQPETANETSPTPTTAALTPFTPP